VNLAVALAFLPPDFDVPCSMSTHRFFEPLPWSIPIRVRQLLSRDDLQLAASRHSWGSKRVGFRYVIGERDGGPPYRPPWLRRLLVAV